MINIYNNTYNALRLIVVAFMTLIVVWYGLRPRSVVVEGRGVFILPILEDFGTVALGYSAELFDSKGAALGRQKFSASETCNTNNFYLDSWSRNWWPVNLVRCFKSTITDLRPFISAHITKS